MAEITRKRTGEFLQKLFVILSKKPEGLLAREALAGLSSNVTLTPYEKGYYESGGQRFEKIVRFATVDCVKAGWLKKNKGRWTVTEFGLDALNKLKDPEAFYKEAVRLYNIWKNSQPDRESERDGAIEIEPNSEIPSGKSISITYEQAEEDAWQEIEHYMTQMQPYDLQEMVAGLLKAIGYYVLWVAPPGKDGGIDIIAQNDPFGTKPPRIKVQVKRQQTSVTVEGLRSFMALLGDSDVGLFVNTGGFTKDAMTEARNQDKRKITLINLELLFDLWVEHYSKLSDEYRGFLPLKPIYFLAPKV